MYFSVLAYGCRASLIDISHHSLRERPSHLSTANVCYSPCLQSAITSPTAVLGVQRGCTKFRPLAAGYLRVPCREFRRPYHIVILA